MWHRKQVSDFPKISGQEYLEEWTAFRELPNIACPVTTIDTLVKRVTYVQS